MFCFRRNDMEQDPAAQYTNGYLFQQYMRQRSVEQAGPSYQVQEPPNANQCQQFPYFPLGGQLQFVPAGRPCSPADSACSSGWLLEVNPPNRKASAAVGQMQRWNAWY